ncbi:MAG TPA: zf-HC2 domain-containing protein [Pyrinomonadaceae bacterium]
MTAAYLDGELEPAAADEFDAHARSCPDCSSSLLEQRRLLCLLDSAFDRTFEKRVELPEGFTRQLKARAQNDLSGVRDARERRRALKICAALAAGAFSLLGFAALDAVTGPAWRAAGAAAASLGVAGRASAEAGAGAGVVLRAVAGRFVSGSEPLVAALLLLLAAGLALLLRLISGYHRAAARD